MLGISFVRISNILCYIFSISVLEFPTFGDLRVEFPMSSFL